MSFDVQFPGLGLEFTINRVALSIGGFNIYWYGVIIAAGMVLAMLFAFRNADDFGINSDRLIDVILVGAVMAIVCARIYYIVFAPFKYESIWQMIDIRQGGIAIYGAVIGAFVFGGLMAKIRRIPILPLFDLVGICFLIGQGVGRWGNFVNQEAFGSNTTLPWGMYSEGTYNYLLSVQATLAAEGVTVDPTQPVHPTFLYESIWCLVGVVLLASHIKKRRFNGELFLLYIIWYGLGRYWIEGLRTDALMVTSTLRTSQLVALVSVATAVVLLVMVVLLPLLAVNELGMGDPFFCKYLCPQGVLEGALPLSLTNAGIRAALGKLFTWKACILLAVIMGSVVFYRPFCKWLCPLGAFYALLNKVSLFQMRVDTHKCVSCGACARACKMDVDITKTPNHAECIRCGMCMKACPTDAIQYKFGLGDQSNTETTKE